MNIEFLATVAVMLAIRSPAATCMSRRWVCRCRAGATAITTASRSPAASRSGYGRSPRPLRRASEPSNGPRTARYRRSASSSTSPTPRRSPRRPGSSSKPDTRCCTELARSHGARRSLGCSHPRARSSASPTRPCFTTDSNPRSTNLRAAAGPRSAARTALAYTPERPQASAERVTSSASSVACSRPTVVSRRIRMLR